MSPNDDADTSGNTSVVPSLGGSISPTVTGESSFAGTILSHFSDGMQTLAKGLFPGFRYIEVPEKNEQPPQRIPLLHHKDFVQTLQQIIRSNANWAQFLSKENLATTYQKVRVVLFRSHKTFPSG
jgi:hypothetical protein